MSNVPTGPSRSPLTTLEQIAEYPKPWRASYNGVALTMVDAKGSFVPWVIVEYAVNRGTTWDQNDAVPSERGMPDVDWLANVIRTIHGDHTHPMGAGAMAESIIEAMRARPEREGV